MRIVTAAEYLRTVDRPEASQPRPDVEDAVRRILQSILERGDEALREWTKTLDNVDLSTPRVDAQEMERAWKKTPAALQKAMKASLASIEKYQRSIKPKKSVAETTKGVKITTDWVPIRRVGAYAPGGRAVYPSTVLMTCAPARVAGVDEVHVASKPGPDGKPHPLVLAAAHAAGADAVWAMGGAQALAAFAFGTKSVPRVDKVVGPGNAYVLEAKRQLLGVVGTDALAGPSELAVWADADTDPELVVLDLMAQAEHDPEARTIVVTTSTNYARNLQRLVKQRVAAAMRAGVLKTSLEREGVIVVADRRERVAELLDAAAPEHVQLMGKGAAEIASKLRAAGTIFEGPVANASLGDYATGANHVLPTGRSARWSNPLSVYDFMRQRVRQRVDRAALQRVGPTAVDFATAEGLPNHAQAVKRRMKP